MAMKIFKIIGGCLLLGILVLIFLLLPTKAEKLESENNALGYVELLQQAKTSDPNFNVYASSQITPDNPLFKGVLALQRRRLDIAVKELLPLAEAGNVDAMYWYGETILYAGAYNSMAGAEWLEKAAELGHPYAALRFDPDNEDCKYYLAGRCSDEWVEKGETLLKARAEQGDVKAQYYANVRSSPSSKAEYESNIALVTQAANQGYYMPLMDKISWFENDKLLDDKEKQAIVELLTLAANNNFVPAMEYLLKYRKEIGDEKFVYWLRRSSVLGSKEGINTLITWLTYDEDFKIRAEYLEAYGFALIASELFSGIHYGTDLFDLYEMKDQLIFTKKEKQQARLAANDFISQMTPVIYIDEFHTEYGKY